jgi:hypothetical protein
LGELGPSPEEELVAHLANPEAAAPRRRAASTEILAERLQRFEAQIHAQRAEVLHGVGNFEFHYVTKPRVNWAAVREARANGTSLDPEQRYVMTTYGPYLDYRWREGKGALYTVHLGRLDDDAAEEESETSVTLETE